MHPTLHYRLSFPDRSHHYLDVAAQVPATPGGLELMLPVWTPGSYLVREYANHLEGFAATAPDGTPLAWRKTRKNRWRIDCGDHVEVRLRYRIYARTLTVQGCFVDAAFASLNGAGIFLAPLAPAGAAFTVAIELPEDWGALHCALPRRADDDRTLLAESFDRLIDSPIYAGNPSSVHRFAVAGREHLLVHEGGQGVWDGERSAADLEQIVAETVALWGEPPYASFLFLNLLREAGASGLEHQDSTLLVASHWDVRTRKGYLDWLSLAAHEFFHTWNVKRLRPVELGPFDYERENYTSGLWVAEGITSYYDDLLVHRAGRATEKEYLDHLSASIERLQSTPGRQVQTLAEASFDTWIKFYRRDESSVNSAISYYTKGAVVAFLLDQRLRAASGGRRSLDDLLRLAYRRFSAAAGFTSEGFEAAASELAGTSLAEFFARAVRSTDELDYAPALDWLGLRFKPVELPAEDEPPRGWLGAKIETRNGALVVVEVPRETPAWDAGLAVEDEIAGLAGLRIRAEDWERRLAGFPPGSESRLLVARRERWIELPVRFGEAPSKRWRLEPDPAATPEQVARRAAWLAPLRAPATTQSPDSA